MTSALLQSLSLALVRAVFAGHLGRLTLSRTHLASSGGEIGFMPARLLSLRLHSGGQSHVVSESAEGSRKVLPPRHLAPAGTENIFLD